MSSGNINKQLITVIYRTKMDDNTSVIRMKRDFDKFISGDRLPCRLDLDQSIGSSGDSNLMNITTGTALSMNLKAMLNKI